MVLHLRSGPRASHDCTILPLGSHSAMRPWLEVHTWPRESAKMPITCPHLKSAGSLNHAGSDLNDGTGGAWLPAVVPIISNAAKPIKAFRMARSIHGSSWQWKVGR